MELVSYFSRRKLVFMGVVLFLTTGSDLVAYFVLPIFSAVQDFRIVKSISNDFNFHIGVGVFVQPHERCHVEIFAFG